MQIRNIIQEYLDKNTLPKDFRVEKHINQYTESGRFSLIDEKRNFEYDVEYESIVSLHGDEVNTIKRISCYG